MKRLIHRLRRGVQLAADYVRSAFGACAVGDEFAQLERFCLFVGYPRSGHSLVGSLIDAHRHAVIAHELDALRYVQFGFSRAQLFWLILDNSRRFTQQGRQWTGYSYAVPSQWQGRALCLKVIGDKRGGDTSRRLARNFTLLSKLQGRVKIPVKVIHVVRNPLDNIAAMVNRGDAPTLSHALRQYDLMSSLSAKVREAVGELNFMTIWLDDLVSAPEETLTRLCDFLGLDAPRDYLDDCAALVFKQPQQARQRTIWQPHHLAQVLSLTHRYDFLTRYAQEVCEASS